jgi:hypothetical protein
MLPSGLVAFPEAPVVLCGVVSGAAAGGVSAGGVAGCVSPGLAGEAGVVWEAGGVVGEVGAVGC